MLRVTELVKNTLSGKKSFPFSGYVVIWNITGRCPLECSHCYANAGPFWKEDPVDEATLLKWAGQLPEAGVRYVVISGGEPLTRWKTAVKIAEKLRSCGIGVALSTSGFTLTRKHIPQIKELFNYVGVSIDGTPAIHDSFRRKRGSWQRAVNALFSLMDNGVNTGIRFTLCRYTFPAFFDTIEWALSKGVPRIYISHIMPAGRGLGLEPLLPDEYVQAMWWLLSLSIQMACDSSRPSIVTGNSEADAILLCHIFREKFPEKYPFLVENLRRCPPYGTAVRILNIDQWGNVFPDIFFRESAGSLLRNTLLEIVEGSPLLARLRERYLKPPAGCEECEWWDICRGGSPAKGEYSEDGVPGKDPACWASSIAPHFKSFSLKETGFRKGFHIMEVGPWMVDSNRKGGAGEEPPQSLKKKNECNI